MSRVLVLGGGVGGLVAATELRRRLPKEHRVTLVDRGAEHRFAPSFLWVLTGRRAPRRLVRSLAPLRRKGIEVLRADVASIDPRRREVGTSRGVVKYDYLVAGLGADLAPEAVPGLSEAGETFYTLEGAARLRDRVQAFQGGRVALVVAATPFKCPAAPYEAAFLLESMFRKRGLRGRVRLDVYTPEKLPMPVAGPAVGGALRAMMEQRGIRFHAEHKVKEALAGKRLLVFEDGTEAPFDLLAYVPPHRAPKVLSDAGLVGETGWVPVDPATLVTKHPGVFVLGDAAAVKLPSGLLLPKAGVFAHGEAEVVARNIAASILGEAPEARFDGHGYCWVETGDGRAAFGHGDFFARPAAKVSLHPPTRYWHWGKVLFEKYWLWKWF